MKKSIALLAALASFSCAAPPPAPTPVDRPRAELIEQLDRLIQTRFATVTNNDILANRLGLGRVAAMKKPWAPAHGLRFEAANAREKETLDRLDAEQWLAEVYLVHDRDDEQFPAMVVGPIRLNTVLPPWVTTPDEIETLGHGVITRTGPSSGSARGAALEARVVSASSSLCVVCHSRKAVGDPLAAVVYAFHPARGADSVPAR